MSGVKCGDVPEFDGMSDRSSAWDTGHQRIVAGAREEVKLSL